MAFSEELDLKLQDLGFSAHFARVRRSIDRFTHFENEPISRDAMEALEDDFLDAVEAVRHLFDWVRKNLPSGVSTAVLDGVTQLPRQQAVKAIGDASKHRGIEVGRLPKYFQGDIWLKSSGQTTRYESLGDFYRRLEIHWGPQVEHPADFLRAALADWEHLLEKEILGSQIADRLRPPE